MDPPSDHVIVPVRIRGKRRPRPEEKWNYGKRRDPKLQQRRPNTTAYGRNSALTPPLSETPPPTSRPRKRRRRVVPESPLESLSPEVLQTIFAYSSNVMLPLTSVQLAVKLCNSMHLRYQLSDRLLYPVLGFEQADARAPEVDLAAATRLLNSRFMDFAFFKTWLRSRSRAEVLASSLFSSSSDDVDWEALWLSFHPSTGLLPPLKLLSTPFSDDKTAFLSVLAQTVDDISSINPSHGELAFEGLTAAVHAGQAGIAAVLLGMGLAPATDHLRAAVIDAECDQRLVRLLLRLPAEGDVPPGHVVPDGIDLLDPMIWSWAERARANDDQNGDWLMDLLRELLGQDADVDQVDAEAL